MAATHLNWATGFDGVTLLVEIGFASTPGTPIGSTTWTNVTADVRSITIQTGKSTEIDSYQPGTATVVLGNRDRRYDPNHASSPYVGNLLPMKRIRISMTYNAVTVRKFTGYVLGFPQAYDISRDATVTVQAIDGFTVLQRTILPSVYQATVLADNPLAYYRLGEPSGVTGAVDSSLQRGDGLYMGTNVQTTGLVTGSNNAHQFDGVSAQVVFGNRDFMLAPFTFECWFVCSAVVASTLLTMFALMGVAVSIDGGSGVAGEIYARVTPTVDSLSYVLPASGSMPMGRSGTDTITIGQKYHLVVEFPNGSVAPTIYLNGTNVTIGTTFAFNPVAFTGWLLGSNVASASNSFFEGVIDEVAFYPGLLSGARIAAHYGAGIQPWNGVGTGTVIGLVLDLAGWPAADRNIEPGRSTVSPMDTEGKTALDVIQALEKTEQGRFFIGPDGVATFYNRHHALVTAASTTSQATFGDAGTEIPYQGIGFDSGESFIRNKVVAGRAGGTTYTVSDATSLTAYLERGESLTGLLNSSDGEIRDLAQWRLAHYKDPIQRIPAIEVTPRHPRSQASTYAAIRDVDLVDRVTVKRRPQGVGAVISQDCLVEGIRHEIGGNVTWKTTLSLSPAEVQAYLVLDDPVLGRLDNNRLAF
jgi:hypothetical protein